MASEAKSDSMRVFVHKNQAGSKGIAIDVSGMTFTKFKRIAGKKLKIKAHTIYLSSGVQVSAMDDMQQDDKLYIATSGESFYKTAGPTTTSSMLHVAVLGAGYVGKSALTLRFVRDFFVKDWDATIEDSYRKTVTVNNTTVPLEILDTAGQDDFEALRPQWMMHKHAYLFVFAMDDRKSLQLLQPFYELYKQINDDSSTKKPIVLAANKSDLIAEDPSRRQVSEEEGRAAAAQFNATYIETSAFNNDNVSAAFETLVKEVLKPAPTPKPAPKPKLFDWCTIL